MTCGEIRNAMPFYYYGELPPEQEEEVEAHCAGCAPCHKEVEDYRKFALALDEAELEPSLGLLSECRDLLAQRVGEWERPAPKPKWWRIDFRFPVAALALLLIGWFAAKLNLPGQSQPLITSLVRSVEPDASGRLTIAVDDVQRRVINGGLNDANVRRLVLIAARDESNPGVQVECVDALKRMAHSTEIRTALMDAVQHDPSPSVRLKALEGLKQFATDGNVRNALSTVLLNDSNPNVRMEVIDLLVGGGARDGSMVGVLQNQVHREDNSYVRIRLQKALQQMNASEGVF